tara:strand:- start:1131 stop:1988 length:858 start_codon:yes stop_codon:yes gene_type:complete
MKTILLFLLPLITFGQITYENGTQDLKKLIVMQTLLAENRIDDLTDFMLKNNYVAVDDNLYIDTSTYKLEKGDVFPFFFISDVPSEQASRMSMANKYISVWFSRVLHDWDTPDAISKNIMYASKLDLRESNLIFGQVFGIVAPIVGSMSFDGGYVPFTHLGAMSGMCEDQNYNCEQIDRYTLKTYDIEKDEEKTFTATNFLNANGLIQSSEEFSNNILFYGPGEYGATLLIYSNNEMKKSETGEAQYSIKLALKSMKRTARNNINVDFFMALKNFNDRIWTDKKF